MRELIIERIRDSHRWRRCWEAGEAMPKLEDMPSKELLEQYNFFVCGVI